MTTLSGHGCRALSTICEMSRNASSVTRDRCGRRNDSIHGMSGRSLERIGSVPAGAGSAGGAVIS